VRFFFLICREEIYISIFLFSLPPPSSSLYISHHLYTVSTHPDSTKKWRYNFERSRMSMYKELLGLLQAQIKPETKLTKDEENFRRLNFHCRSQRLRIRINSTYQPPAVFRGRKFVYAYVTWNI
jgi:hypothetical protein